VQYSMLNLVENMLVISATGTAVRIQKEA